MRADVPVDRHVLPDEELPDYMNDNNAGQLLHITASGCRREGEFSV
ncbi:hypothetical protein [Paenibacillus sp. J2TS4]|nr:hypothetical protein [Paenibacillus sp. J2TS4]